jgi:hypothetical protein
VSKTAENWMRRAEVIALIVVAVLILVAYLVSVFKGS